MPVKTQITCILAAICGYQLFPVDVLPDFIPVIGGLDDMGVLLLGIKKIIELVKMEQRQLVVAEAA